MEANGLERFRKKERKRSRSNYAKNKKNRAGELLKIPKFKDG